ncbi:MAG TPA: SDR family oxidoreductase [Pseudolabrys sp.]|nr:SDR family oxidoreductase [Pseudolabrys sp.]
MQHRKGDGQTALITGASSGIGLELARHFASDGYDLVLAARSADALRKIAADLTRDFSIKATPIACDLARPNAGAELAQAIHARAIEIDVLVNNAGYGVAHAFDSSDAAAELGMIDLNIRALVELTHILWPRMLKNKRGGVLNLGSTAGFQPGPFMAVYCASKAFVLSFTEALWEEARDTGVHVSCLCPGITATGFHKRAGTDKLPLLRGRVMPAATVARLGYRAFQANRRVEITGFWNAIMANAVRFIPRTSVLRVARRLMHV